MKPALTNRKSLMKEFLKKIRAALKETRNRLASHLSDLPPGDQLVAQPAVQSLISDMNWFQNRLKDIVEVVGDDDDAVTAEVAAAMTSVIADALSSGQVHSEEGLETLLAARIEKDGLLPPEVVTAQIAAAREEATAGHADQILAMRNLAERRDAALQEHGTAILAMAEEDFLAEDHAKRVTLFAGRLAALEDLGLSLEEDADTVQVFCGNPLTDDGEKIFQGLILASSRAKLKVVPDEVDPAKSAEIQAGAEVPAKSSGLKRPQIGSRAKGDDVPPEKGAVAPDLTDDLVL
jgi:hypothetical protein